MASDPQKTLADDSEKYAATIQNDSGNGDVRPADHDSIFDKQILTQRDGIFTVVLVACGGLYSLFVMLVFFHDPFYELASKNPMAVSLALSLLIVPSALLWGIIRSVYRPRKTSEEPSSLSTEMVKFIAAATNALSKVWPASGR